MNFLPLEVLFFLNELPPPCSFVLEVSLSSNHVSCKLIVFKIKVCFIWEESNFFSNTWEYTCNYYIFDFVALLLWININILVWVSSVSGGYPIIPISMLCFTVWPKVLQLHFSDEIR